MNNELKALIYCTMIGSLLKEFDGDAHVEAIEDLKSTVGSFIRSRSHQKKKNGKLIPVRQRPMRKVYIEAVTIGDQIWQNSIDEYKGKDFAIEIYSTINGLWSKEADLLSKMAGITEKKMDRFMLTCEQDHTTESEQRAYEIAEHLTNYLNSYKTGSF